MWLKSRATWPLRTTSGGIQFVQSIQTQPYDNLSPRPHNDCVHRNHRPLAASERPRSCAANRSATVSIGASPDANFCCKAAWLDFERVKASTCSLGCSFPTIGRRLQPCAQVVSATGVHRGLLHDSHLNMCLEVLHATARVWYQRVSRPTSETCQRQAGQDAEQTGMSFCYPWVWATSL